MSAPLSVVVPTRDRPEHLDRCLAALRAGLRDDDELIVVDSASRDAASVAHVATGHGARLLRAGRPGASLARNLGWRAARHSLVGFVDDDMEITPDWAGAVTRPFEDPDVTFVTGRVEVPPHQAGMAGPVAVKTDPEPARLDAATAGALGGSNNLAVRAAALDAVGGFEERLGPGTWFASAEDVDLLDRLFARSWWGRYEPAALAFHHQWRDRRELLALAWGYGKGMGARLARERRRDPARARRIAVEVAWRGGVHMVVRSLVRGYEFGALSVATRTAGTVVGFVVALLRRLPS